MEIETRFVGSCCDKNDIVLGENCEELETLGQKNLLSVLSITSCGTVEDNNAEGSTEDGGLVMIQRGIEGPQKNTKVIIYMLC